MAARQGTTGTVASLETVLEAERVALGLQSPKERPESNQERAAESDATGDTDPDPSTADTETGGDGSADRSESRTHERIRPRVRHTPHPQLDALCLSGGGIRSATFALGVLQSLARHKLLERFHYLSTVSGGGYVGGWLAAWISRRGFRAAERGLGRPTMISGRVPHAGAADSPPLRRLRAYSNFLSPVRGLSGDFLALVSIYLRNLLLHWAVILPLGFAALLLPRLMLAGAHSLGDDLAHLADPLLVTAAFLFALSSLGAELERPRTNGPGADPPARTGHRTGLRFFVPQFAGALVLPLAFAARPALPGTELGALAVAAYVGGTALGLIAHRVRQRKPPDAGDLASVVASALTSAAAVALGGGLLVTLAADHELMTPQRLATLGPPAVLGVLWVAYVARAGLTRRFHGELHREWWGRVSGITLVLAIGWLLLAGGSIQFPQWLFEAERSWSGTATGASTLGAFLIAIGTGVYGYWSRYGRNLKARTEGFAAKLGLRTAELAALLSLLALMLIANLIIAYALTLPARARYQEAVLEEGAGSAARIQASTRLAAEAVNCLGDLRRAAVGDAAKAGALLAHVVNGRGCTREGTPIPSSVTTDLRPLDDAPLAQRWIAYHEVAAYYPTVKMLLMLIAILLFGGMVASFFIGTNAFSMNALYGNRLTRAYLGASKLKRRPHPYIGFDTHDNLALAEVKLDPERPCLYPVVNAALNLVRPSGSRLEWQQRKAASFVMTPDYCGSDVVGFVRSDAYGGRDGISLGRAMAISGAAASPSMGFHSSFLVSMVMAFLNLRLGWWLPNPRVATRFDRDEPDFGLGPVLSELFSTTGDHRSFVNVSDGGHFENLGLYEMVRRRCRRDPASGKRVSAAADLGSVLR